MKDFAKLPADLQAIGKRFKQHQEGMLREMGKEAVNETRQVFREQGFNGTAWPDRKVKDDGRNLLVDTGTMRRSISYSVVSKVLRIGLDLEKVPYAKAHNEGYSGKVTQNVRKHKRGSSTVRAHTRQANINIPQRQFIGITPRLVARWRKALKKYVRRYIFQP